MGAAVLLLTLFCTPAPAHAQRSTSQYEARLQEAMDAYDNLELDRAATVLDNALGQATNVGADDPVVARLYLMRGIVEWALSGDRAAVIDAFVAGLTIDRQAELNVYYATPDLSDLLEEARANLPAAAPPRPANSLSHAPAVTVRSGQALDIAADIDRGAAVERVVLYFKGFGQARYTARDLEIRSPTRFVGTVPSELSRQGIQYEYYLEALGDGGEVLGNSGTAASPHVVVILDDGGGASPSGEHILGATLGLGTGGGLATGEPLVMGDDVDLNPGVALTPLHFYVDVTFRVAEAIEVGPFLRLQTVLLQDGLEIETLVGGKLKWFFDNEGSPRMYASVGAGYGYVRHTVDLSPTIDFVDTTREGPFHGGVGFGAAWLFTENVGLITDLYAMVLFDEVSVQLDLNLGLYLAF